MLQLDRVTRVVKGGRRMRFRATVVIGDRAGRVAVGLGKGADVQIAMQKAVADARKNVVNVSLVNDTIPHPAEIKFKSARMVILPASDGTGIIAGGALRKVAELAGIRNCLSKNIGTSNRVVVAQAAVKMLASLRETAASKAYVEGLKKERAEAQKKEAAARAESDKAGRKPRGGKLPAPKKAEEKTRMEKEIETKKEEK